MGYEYHGGKSKKYEPDKTKNYSIPIIDPKDEKEERIVLDISKNVIKIIFSLNEMNHILKSFNSVLSNQTITEPKSCNFGKYFDSYDLYEIKRETFNKINETEAQLDSINILEDNQKLEIFVTINDESKNQIRENIKAIELTIEDEDIRKFIFLSLQKVIDDRKGKGFGTGNILSLLKKMYVPYYVTNAQMNIKKIKEVIKEFNHNSKDFWWKSEDNKDRFNSLTDVKKEIRKTDEEIDELVYKLYGLTDEEKKFIEDSLKWIKLLE